eukprot:CAMPEP_0114320134 /NCGR_PEP_ID=MMETSP0059-20121206/25741_1 /TAXON_ID=36894 /ORGANISM="Pyramimonas parkeae, Strain CCMP726" /LENGTH=139 /DNA_ID=CAMNT_0001447445 /DNA_START=112 /DNA_END=528 /DNA_ORIENTATION=+
MSSEYGTMRNIERARLLSQLVAHLTDCKPPDENFDIALEYCQYHTQYHTFLDTATPEVIRLYNGLFEKLRAHAQLGKARALQSLAEMSIGLVDRYFPPAHVYERSARILHLLFACAQSPLKSSFDANEAAKTQQRALAL